jgi:hypothetical protein
MSQRSAAGKGTTRRSPHPLSRSCILAPLLLLATLAFSATPALASSSPPAIETESVSAVTEHDATLQAQIETGGLYTGYQFEISTSSSYDFTRFVCPYSFPGSAQCMSIVDGKPLPAGLVEPKPQYILAGSGEESVSLDLASIGATLQPGTTYHYEVTAANEGSRTVRGPDQTFTTPSAGTTGTAPAISNELVSGVTEHAATIEAQIDPEGLETTYEIWLGFGCEETPEGATCALVTVRRVGPVQIAAGDSTQTISAELRLEPSHRYTWRVIARNSAGETIGNTVIFYTPTRGSEAPVPGNTTEVPAPGNTTPPSDTTPSATSGAGPSEAPGAASTGSPSMPAAPPLVSPLGQMVEHKALTGNRKLARALIACAKRPKKQRAGCRKQAQHGYVMTVMKADAKGVKS